MRTLPPDLAPLPSWRQSVLSKSLTREALFPDSASEKWSALAVKVHATGLFGMEIVDLLNITHEYQLRQRTKVSLLQIKKLPLLTLFRTRFSNHRLPVSPPVVRSTTCLSSLSAISRLTLPEPTSRPPSRTFGTPWLAHFPNFLVYVFHPSDQTGSLQCSPLPFA